MNVIAIEDEPLLLDALELAIREAEPKANVTVFGGAADVLGWPESAEAEVAFIDVKLGNESGIRIARRLLELNPRMNIIFTTSYSAYMREAFDLHASGYINKPVTAEKVRHEFDALRFPLAEDSAQEKAAPVLEARCFGNFEAYVNGERLRCESAYSLEFLAYLVDRHGTRCSMGEIEAALWGDTKRTSARQSHLRNILSDLRRSLREAGCEEVVYKQYRFVALNTALVSCDYWDYLDNKPGARDKFRGEYMSQYSWAERTLANLLDF